MYFVKRGDEYIDVAGQSFRDLLAGRLAALPGERATLSDWANHVSTIFPEVRLKRYLEMRGADGGPWRMLPALPAFWVGFLYDEASPRCRVGHREGLDCARSVRNCATMCREQGLQGERSAAARCSISRRIVWRWRTRALSAATAATARAATRRVYLEPLGDIVRARLSRRPKNCCRNFTARGAVRSNRYSPNTPTERASEPVFGHAKQKTTRRPGPAGKGCRATR